MKKTNMRVAITGFGGLDMPHAGSCTARALRQGWPGQLTIDALVDDSDMTGAWQPGIINTLSRIESAKQGDEAFFHSLLNAQKKLGFNALIPCLEQDIAASARLAQRLQEQGINTLLPPVEQAAQLVPIKLPQYLHRQKIPHPHCLIAHHLHDVPHYADQLAYPLRVTGGNSSLIAYNSEQAQRFARALFSQDRRQAVLLQKHVHGDAYSMAAIVNDHGKIVQHLSCRKLAINSNGQAVCSCIINNPSIDKQGLAIIKKLNTRGPVTLDLVLTANGQYCLLEAIHFCLPDWSMLSHWAGNNLPVALLQELFKQEGQALNEQNKAIAIAPTSGAPLLVRSITEIAMHLHDVQRLERHGHLMCDDKQDSTQAHAPLAAQGGQLSLVSDKKTVALQSNSKPNLRVAITGTSSFDLINPGIGVARALRHGPEHMRLIGLCYGTFDSGAYNKTLFDASFQLPTSSEADVLLDRLKQIVNTEPIDVLIPCLDGEIPLFISLSEELKKLGIQTLLPSQDSFEKRSKSSLFSGNYSEDQGGFSIPATIKAHNEDEVLAAVKQIGLPAVVKGPISFCVVIDDINQAKSAWHTLNYEGMKHVLIQGMIRGQSFAVATVCNHQHQPISMLTVKKLSLCRRGSTWQALRLPQAELESSFARFLREIKWVGPIEGEFIRDKITDRFYLIEMNPRFTGWIFYSAALGSNQPHQAIHTALGNSLKTISDKSDLVFIRSSSELHLQSCELASFSIKGYLNHV